LVDMAYKEVPQLYLVSPVVFTVLRSWVKGYYYNPVHPGTYFYPISKG
jgi:ABC-type transport system substrate-binding protein